MNFEKNMWKIQLKRVHAFMETRNIENFIIRILDIQLIWS